MPQTSEAAGNQHSRSVNQRPWRKAGDNGSTLNGRPGADRASILAGPFRRTGPFQRLVIRRPPPAAFSPAITD
ncbi:MAG TPA: hypothetical protein VH518_17910 [Tepidisphaeraceae bacterium]